ncbi:MULTISPECIES: peptidase S8 [unclassified Exiguobacterium]|uniref:S8 family peptidase n=1 Tax=unclassified Exiguobacterium TaxID=2644629 RepID=UPI00103D9589|nr:MULTISPECIES: peptidase S8 [unclassified Exiguobacterium]TCI48169.1 peptidase S8 [Exiguobacterium sp. SH5S32]TCI55056.1 peptidase S8 [Exiguobacterium sp. SH1S4]TCI74848.1 peptidase S8 [Exiguobacterium sp. SH1S1]
MKRLVQRTVATLLAVLLIVSLVPPRIHADAGAGMKQATLLEAGEAVTFTTGVDPVNTYWFKMERGAPSQMTHMEIVMEATKLANVSVYPSADMAGKDDTFYPYRASASKEDGKATIHLPYAWEGPYYVKVEYMPMETPDMYPPEEEIFSLEEGEEPSEEGTEPSEDGTEPPSEPDPSEFASEINLVYNPVKLPVKYEQASGDMCAVESILMPASDQKTMLELIRRVQTDVLNQSEEGRELAALYYRASPYIIKAITFDKTKRQAAYNDLVTLKPLLTALVERKQHTVSSKESAAINRMHALVSQSVPEGLKADIASVAGLAGMDELAGTPLTDVFDRIGVTVNVTDAPRYIVKYKSSPNQSIGKMNAMRDVSAERLAIGSPGDHFALVDVETASAKTKASAQAVLESDPNVDYIEPIETYSAFMADPSYSYQWSVNSRSVLKPFGDAGISLDKYEALNLKARTVKVAVLDTGVDHRLLDLKGKVDVRNGKNFVDPNGEGDAIDDHGHGTHVAGVIAAAQNNGTSMRGIVPNVSILPVKVLDAGGYGETDQIALGIKYAVDAGAKVINMSLGGTESRTIGYMLKYAHDRGVIIVAATGNDGQSRVSYPASSKYTISVGATNTFGLVTDYSNYGINVDVVAPGSKVASLVPDGNVVYMDGTSMATPHVASAVALLVSQHPRVTVEGVRTILRRSSEPLAFTGGDAPKDPREYDGMQDVLDGLNTPLLPYYDVVSGYGKVNVYRAESMLQLAPKPERIFDNAPVFNVSAKSGTVVNVYNKTKRIGWGTVKNGKLTMSLAPQKAGTVLRVTYTNGPLFTGERVVVAKGLRPSAPSVTAPRANAKQVTGKAQAGMTVVVRDQNKRVIGKSKIALNGTYVAKTRALKKGERLSVHVEDVTKKVSKITTVTVK